ncbi:peptidylprolyl isomerase [Hydrogenophaga sp. OTU3427]|uniref:peptidylprolyl isomerase n=1 Tax=Hydrogenophaga sp. OTU3427 TaxID=3043856 RepID=UPI00313EA8C3
MKPMLRTLAAGAVLALAAPAFAQNVAIVNGKPVPSARVDALLEQVTRSGRPVDDALKAQVKDEIIAREVFSQEAEKRGIKASKEYKAQVELAAQTILIRELFADYQKKNPVTDAEIKAEYDKFAAANAGQEYRARHILVEKEDEAKAIIASLQKGGNFEEIAKKQSKDPGSGANGGDLDWANASSYVPEFSDAMTKLKKGELTAAPVKSQFGFHIIRLDDVRQAQLPPLEELRPQISQQMAQQRLASFQEELRKKAKIK